MLTEQELITRVVKIVSKHLGNDGGLFLFGSRVAGRGNSRSDFDFGVDTGKKIPLETWSRIEEEIDELSTLFRIEVVDFQRVSAKFREQALKHIILFSGKAPNEWMKS